MIIKEIRNIKSGKKELRQFGITVGVFLGLLAGLFLLRQRDYYLYFFIFSLTFIFLGLVLPATLKHIQKIWMSLGILIGWLVTRVILTVLFYLVVTPIGVIAKVFGKHLLDTKFNPDADSYWMAKETVKFDKKGLENQF